MSSITESYPAWSRSLTQPGTEFPPTPLEILEGAIPQGLRGTLYRNGPGRLERGGVRVGHWFDGDGAILAVKFTDEGATGVYRYVQTEGYCAEGAANQFLYSNYGRTAPGPLWQRWGKRPKHSANTSVLALPDKLLALWEGDRPYRLDLETLDTEGKDDLSQLQPGMSYSAHPKVDAQTGEIFNFGTILGAKPKLCLYKSDRTGKILQMGEHVLKSVSIIHDFVLAGPYLVFFIPPIKLKLFPILLGTQCFSDALEWQPNGATQILIFDRQTLSLVSQQEAPPWFQWHFSNGFMDEQGNLAIDFARYEDFQTNTFLKEVPSGKTHTKALSQLWRSHLNPKTGELIDHYPLIEQHSEFPIVSPLEVGKPARYTYLSMHRPGTPLGEDLLNVIARWDNQTQTLEMGDPGLGSYPTEPLYVPSPETEEKGWVLTVIYHSSSHTSEIWIYDAHHLSDSPVCRLGLPSVIPIGFHGTFANEHQKPVF
ncbi:carotenoid oxygenase family protein [Roseofilum reptotaenium CS-1145]|uniref:Uncharacterized protein n=1 Tax=Roseofilum reptotaenium AO1-A TaxID=1925591 RepID=A0A1L9QL37_9CYAN|nr:carotenoid oxygenase family protein [Roseofilum reptotaenium]MDB9517114.1 carotenoid oxygenase family protein [Roseofilum reptotaenium CS-1145]OJJ18933.1 hypothetical protein BI308_21915 [Roseofilum reptotaenium AO1-A]